MSEYAKGPWREGIEGNLGIYGPDGQGEDSGLIARVYKGRGNVRLITAAPEMAEMLLRFSKNEPVGDIELRNLLKKAGVLE